MLADFIFLGTSPAAGSYALSSDKTRLFALSLDTLLDVIAGQVNARLLPMLWRLNGLDPALMPKARFGPVETPSIEAMAQFVERLTRSGVRFDDPETQSALREAASLPPYDPDAMPEPPAPPAPPSPSSPDPEPPAKVFDLAPLLKGIEDAA